jgi:hypothetical protein
MAKKMFKKRRGAVVAANSGITRAKMFSKRYSSEFSGRVRLRLHDKENSTVQIFKAVDKIYNQETSDIERLARIYSIDK